MIVDVDAFSRKRTSMLAADVWCAFAPLTAEILEVVAIQHCYVGMFSRDSVVPAAAVACVMDMDTKHVHTSVIWRGLTKRFHYMQHYMWGFLISTLSGS
jgi:hypothetical protein